jgi:predicted nucleic acid-binding protein
VNFLLDTNIVSEWIKPRPDAGVMDWLAEADEDGTFLSAVTIAEIRYGIERLPRGFRRDRLDAWLTEELPLRFEDRILPIDTKTGDGWGHIMARGRAAGRPIAAMDAFIAATSERYDLTLVTRNVADFEVLGIPLINPWRG